MNNALLQSVQLGLSLALLLVALWLLNGARRVIMDVTKGKISFNSAVTPVSIRIFLALACLASILSLSSIMPKSQIQVPSPGTRAQEFQKRDGAPLNQEIRPAAPTFEKRAGQTEELGHQVREDFEALTDAE